GEGSASVRTTLEQNLATGAIGRFLIRGEIDKAATEAQRLRYEELFPLYIAAAYAEEIGQLASREIRISGSLERKPGDLIVRSALFDAKGAKRANIDWRIRLTGDGEYKLFDVLVERISPLITRRQSFSQKFEDEGLEGLLAHMQQTIDAGIMIETDDE
ncbi:MAG: ABC transporter substrate-binding protein, partial [Pseudomonadota bacterium]